MKDLFHRPEWSRFFHWVGAIPIDRHQVDSGALRTTLQRLCAGAVVGIFPEGGIRSGKTSILEGAVSKPGLGTLSALSGAPVVPCVILGTDRLYESRYWNPLQRLSGGGRAPVWIAFGKPIPPDLSLSRAQARVQVHHQVTASLRALASCLKEQFQLRPEDLPQTAQQRRNTP